MRTPIKKLDAMLSCDVSSKTRRHCVIDKIVIVRRVAVALGKYRIHAVMMTIV